MSLRPQREFFTKVKIARELLREKSEEILADYLDVVAKARDAGEYEVAAKSLQWLIEHMPADEDGKGLVDVSVDKKQQAVVQGPTGPTIQIGIQVGGLDKKQLPIDKPKELPAVEAEVIDG
jgi:hypothetical protein